MSTNKNETAEGILRYDIDEGWVLSRPKGEIRICDLFPDFDGKKVRVTVEILPEEKT